MKANIFCWLLLIRSNVLSLKEVLHFRGERNQGPQLENVVNVSTKAVTTDEITACFRLWYRYPSMQILLGPDMGATIGFTYEINTGRGWIWFGEVLRKFVWSEAKPLKWYSVCFTANIEQHLRLVIDGQIMNMDPANDLNSGSSVQLPRNFNQGLYSTTGQETPDHFFGKLADLTVWTDQLGTKEMVAFTSGCDSLTGNKGNNAPNIK